MMTWSARLARLCPNRAAEGAQPQPEMDGDDGRAGAAQAHQMQSPAWFPWWPHNRRRDRGLREGENEVERAIAAELRKERGGGGGLQSRLTGHTVQALHRQTDGQTGRQRAHLITQMLIVSFNCLKRSGAFWSCH